MRVSFLAALLMVSAMAVAEDAAVVATPDTTEVVQAPSDEGKIIGSIDLRPSFAVSGGNSRTENTFSLGYQFNPNLMVGAVQYVDTNLWGPGDTNVNVRSSGTLVRAKFNNIWTNEDEGLALHYEPRFYLPTTTSLQDEGLITYMRNYVKFSKEFSDTFTLTLMELPIFYFHSKPGNVRNLGTVDEEAVANKAFENRIYLVADFDLGAGFTFSVPLFFHQARHRNFQVGAKNNDTWSFFLYTWPELTYQLAPNYSIGLSYYSENWVSDDLSSVDIAKGLEQGTAQFVFTATL